MVCNGFACDIRRWILCRDLAPWFGKSNPTRLFVSFFTHDLFQPQNHMFTSGLIVRFQHSRRTSLKEDSCDFTLHLFVSIFLCREPSGEGRPTWAQVMISRFVGWSPASGSVLTVRSLEPASDSVSPSLYVPPLLMLCLSLSLSLSLKINKTVKTKLKARRARRSTD